jgi:predicted metal-dependent phosphoesterase TrpH
LAGHAGRPAQPLRRLREPVGPDDEALGQLPRQRANRVVPEGERGVEPAGLRVADVVEVFNSRAFAPAWNRRAAALAAEHGVPVSAGSDAHLPWEIGRAYLELPAFSDAGSFLQAVRDGTPVGV